MATVASLLISLRAETKDFQAGLQKAQAELKKTQAAIAALGQGASREATADLRKLEQDLRRQIGNIEKSARQSLQQTQNAFTSFRNFLGAFGVGLGLSAIVNELRQVVDVGIRVQALSASFRAVTGSAAQSRSELAFVAQVSDRLGFDILDLTDSYRGLAAAARGTVLEGQQQRDIFTAIAEAGRTLGFSSEQLNGSLVAVQQIISKGTVSSEELRGQLGERLPGAFQIAARAIGVTTEELGKMLQAGQVLSTEFLPRFAAQLRRELGGGAEEASRTAGAAFTRAGNDITAIRDRIASSGLVEFLARVAEGFTSLAAEAVGAGRAARQAINDIDSAVPNASPEGRARFQDFGSQISILQGSNSVTQGLRNIFSSADPARRQAVEAEVARLRAEQQRLIDSERNRTTDPLADISAPSRVTTLVQGFEAQQATIRQFLTNIDKLNLGLDGTKLKLSEVRQFNDKLTESIAKLPFEDAQAVVTRLGSSYGEFLTIQTNLEEQTRGTATAVKGENKERREAERAIEAQKKASESLLETLQGQLIQISQGEEAFRRYQISQSNATEGAKEQALVILEQIESQTKLQARLKLTTEAYLENEQALGILLAQADEDAARLADDRLLQQARDYEQITQAIERLNQRGGNAIKSFASDVGEAFSRASDAIAELIREGTFDFNRFVTSILADLARLAAQRAIIQPISNAIGGAINSGTAAGGGGFDFAKAGGAFLSSLLGAFGGGSDAAFAGSTIEGFRSSGFTSGLTFAGGGIMSGRGPIPLRQFQTGGVARGPQLALFGEGSTPEAFVPVPNGRIPVDLRGSGGATINVVFPGVTNRQEADGIRRSTGQVQARILQAVERANAKTNVPSTAGR